MTMMTTPEEAPGGASLRGPHRLAAMATCPRLWAYRYYDYRRSTSDKPYRFGGTLIHTCYEYFYASRMPEGERPAWFYKESLQDKLQRQVLASGMPYEDADACRNMALANLEAYMLAYPNDSFRVLSVEREYMTTLGTIDPDGPWPELHAEVVTCRSDLVYEEPDGGIWIMDYKSKGRSGTNPRTGRLVRWNDSGEYALDFQVLVNLVIVRAVLGPRVRGFVVLRTTRQAPYDFDRNIIPITVGPDSPYAALPRAMRELVKQERDTEALILEGREPTPRFNACWGRYGACDYRAACLAPDREARQRILDFNFEQPAKEELANMRARLRVEE